MVYSHSPKHSSKKTTFNLFGTIQNSYNAYIVDAANTHTILIIVIVRSSRVKQGRVCSFPGESITTCIIYNTLLVIQVPFLL